MKLVSKEDIKKFQEGGLMGAAPAPAEGAQPQGGEDPMGLVLAAFQEAVQTNNCELCMQAALALLQIVAQSQLAAPEGETVYQKCGGKMVKKTKKVKK